MTFNPKRKIIHFTELTKNGISDTQEKKPLIQTGILGMRTIKSGLAIFVALLLAKLPIVHSPFYVSIGTIFALQSTVKNSFAMGRQRILGTLLGGLIGFLFACLPWQNALSAGLAAILTIIICNQTKNSAAISISITICLSILLSIDGQHPLIYSLNRTFDTALGLGLGVLINYFIARPKYFRPLLDTFNSYIVLIQNQVEILEIQGPLDLQTIKEELNYLDQLTEHYLCDSFSQSERPELVQDLNEICHDLRFYLKGLVRLTEIESIPLEKIHSEVYIYQKQKLTDTLSEAHLLFEALQQSQKK